jgi:hypothetical protein
VDISLIECNDPHTAAGLLKLYFRLLPEPLLTFDAYDSIIAAFDESGDKKALQQRTVPIVAEIPLVNYQVLKYLCSFLYQVSLRSEKNKMTIQNLATVFGPNVIRPLEEDYSIMVKHSSSIAGFLELLIERHEAIFKVNIFQNLFCFFFFFFFFFAFPL